MCNRYLWCFIYTTQREKDERNREEDSMHGSWLITTTALDPVFCYNVGCIRPQGTASDLLLPQDRTLNAFPKPRPQPTEYPILHPGGRNAVIKPPQKPKRTGFREIPDNWIKSRALRDHMEALCPIPYTLPHTSLHLSLCNIHYNKQVNVFPWVLSLQQIEPKHGVLRTPIPDQMKVQN